MSKKYDVVIIGAGLGGLECGLMLSKHGKSVCVLEKDALIGGCLQTFRRDGHKFDTGFHYVGGLEDGQMLHRLFDYFGLLDLPWVKMDADCCDEVVICGNHYRIPQGYSNYQKALENYFPEQKNGIAKWVDLLQKIGENTDKSFEPRSSDEFYAQSLFAQSAYEYLKSIFSDDRIIDVISGPSLKMELNVDKLPLYTFAQINGSFIQSAYRLKDGGMQIAETLRKQIENNGGEVFRNAEVTGVSSVDGQLKAVIVNGTEEVEAENFISDVHPATTMNILSDSGLVRNIYRKRINNLENTFGMFTTHIKLKPQTIKYINHNIFAYSENNLWHIEQTPSVTDVKEILISMNPPSDDNQEYVNSLDVLTPMKWEEVERWFGTKIGYRGADYDQMKQNVAEKCITMASEYINGLSAAIDKVYTSTPLTYTDYTGTKDGSAYGIRKDYNQLMFTVLTPRTPVANLFLTGQSLNLHGILGTSMTAMFTCAEVLGMETIVNDLKKTK